MEPATRSRAASSASALARENIASFREREVTILFADLRGYTAMGAHHSSTVMIEVLDRFLAQMSDLVIAHYGTVDKFIGDAVMAVFGAPLEREDHVRQAIACAAAMQAAVARMDEDYRARGLPEVYAGIGINTGRVLAGWLGSPQHREYSVVGNAVNLASRIESLSLRGQVLLGQRSCELAGDFARVGEAAQAFVKGQPEPVTVHELLGIPELGLEVRRRDLRRSHRVRVHMPVDYQLLEGKLVRPEIHNGTVHDIGYRGLLAELHAEVADFSDIKLSLDLSPMGYRAPDIYGKVVHTSQRQGRRFCAVEFTSVTLQTDVSIRQFVQMLLQGYPVSEAT
ncbi:MAG: adenylate/guanylate cyclase domain-containing protein [Gammaproteobacteria bacterium]